MLSSSLVAFRGLSRSSGLLAPASHGWFSRCTNSSSSSAETPEIVTRLKHELTQKEEQKRNEVLKNVDDQIRCGSYGRLFAGIYCDSAQRKVTTGDLVMFNYDMGMDVGEEVTLEKVTLVGGRDFTLLGRPVLPRDLVSVTATVVEKNLDRTRVSFHGKVISRGRTKFERKPQTTLRITAINLLCPIEEAVDRIGFEARKDDPAFL